VDIGPTLPSDVAGDLLAELVGFKSRFDVLLRVSHDGTAHVDSNGVVARWNPAAERLTGIAESSAVGERLHDILIAGAEAVLATDSGVRQTHLAFASPSGRAFDVEAHIVPIRHAGDIDGWLLTFSDPGRYAEIEQLKSELVGSISHELKTPLATIKAFVDTLTRADGRLEPALRRDYLATICEQVERLGSSIDKMLMVSRVEAGQLLARRVSVPLDGVLDGAFEAIRWSEARHPVTRRTAGADISGDPDLLREAFAHVLDNAAKFSPIGTPVAITASSRDGSTIVEIADRGAGIAEEHLPYIFDRFYRVDNGLAASIDGTGLGLFIALALARAHGGTITVRSELGRGTTFAFSLPERV
jgi:PAS domain S-box-containing protein